MAVSYQQDLLATLLPQWHQLLQGWSADGSLVAATQEALLLEGEPQALTDLVTQWSGGDFSGIPPIVLLTDSDISGAMGAYAISTGRIYLNQDWLVTATPDQVNAVLTEELGHHLDGLLNAVDTPGDEGEYFQRLLSGESPGPDAITTQEDHGFISLEIKLHAAEFASVVDSSPATYGGRYWQGSNEDDRLTWIGGGDIIDGMTGYDSLAIARNQSETSLILNPNGSIYLRLNDDLRNVYLTLIGIEQISFLDALLTLDQTTSGHAVVDQSIADWGRHTWLGSPENDLLYYMGGADIIKGNGGVDTLNIAQFSQSSSVLYDSEGAALLKINDEVTIGDAHVTLLEVEKIAFFDTELTVDHASYASTVVDETLAVWLGRSWEGTNGDDHLFWLGGGDIVNGKAGRDALHIAKSSNQATILKNSEGIGFIVVGPEEGHYGHNNIKQEFTVITTIDVERVAFIDRAVEIEPVPHGSVFIDPSIPVVGGTSWTGSAKDDQLIWLGGGDSIDGLGGFDVLNIPQYKSQVTLLPGDQGDLLLSLYDNWTQGATINLSNIERVSFLDGSFVMGQGYGIGSLSVITGNDPFNEGVTLTAGTVTGDPDGDGPITAYQWYLNDDAISGATSSSYTTTATSFGNYKVNLTYTDGQGFSATLTSAEQVVSKVDNDQGSLSSITSSNLGIFQEGVRLTSGSITGDPDGNGTITGYQWYFNDAAITTNGTSSTYEVSKTGYGNYKVAVTYKDGQDFVTTLTTANQDVSKVDNGDATVSITGTATVGSTLTANISTADPDGNGTFTYQWQSGSGNTWGNISNATNSTYTLTSNDLNKQVRVVVSSTDQQGYSATLNSNASNNVAPPPDTTLPTITDISVQGSNVILNFSEKVQSTGISNSTFAIKVGGTGRAVSATNYDSTNQKVTLTLSGTAPASSTSLQVTYAGTSPNIVKDIAGNSLGTFTNRSADTFLSGASVTSLYADYTNLTLTGTTAINGTGNAKNNTITGNQANNSINGAVGADVLTGQGGTDTFVYTTLANSLLGTPTNYTFDRITDFVIGQDKLDGPKTVSTTQLQKLGAVATLDQTGLQAVLTTTKFVANGAATFTYVDNGATRRFVAMNDGVAGFDVTKDAVVEITGATGLITNLSIV